MAKRKTAKTPKAESLLVELLTEELPPKSLKRLSEAFADGVVGGLREHHFLGARAKTETYATPRRLAVRVSDVIATQPDRVVERKGPSAQAGLDAQGKPTPALLGFARSCGVDASNLERRKDEKGEHFVFQTKQKGEPLARHLAAIVETSLKKLPVAKLMRWGAGEVQFVRPVHGLILLYGSKVVPGVVLGLKSGNKTLGHRFLSNGTITIKRASDYEKTLRIQGKVIASFDERRASIVRELYKVAAKSGRKATWNFDKAQELLDEVTNIVESPRVYAGDFESSFLEVPRDCLVASMRQHLRYFPMVLMDEPIKPPPLLESSPPSGKLLPRFLFVSNMHPADASQIVHGNERVLRARLSDAKFFYDQDRKTSLSDRVERLKDVVYQSKLGSQYERVLRIQKLAGEIARQVHASVEWAERAAYLSKADLVTDMVGEFPELQGTMGYYYLRDSDPQVAELVREHYLPRFAGDELPRSADSISVALADKLDTLVGIYGVGLVPTGDKDPFGLRRQALGVVRILVERKNIPSLDILKLLHFSASCFPAGVIANTVVANLHVFILERLKSYLREHKDNYAPDEIDAVLALNPTQLDEVLPRLRAIKKFRALPEGMALAAANKRIQNILRQAGNGDVDKIVPAIDGALLQEDAEKELARQLGEVSVKVHPLLSAGNYDDALKELAGLRGAVDAFFDKVMVMVDDESLRTARLQLLAEIRREFRYIADVSRLQG